MAFFFDFEKKFSIEGSKKSNDFFREIYYKKPL